MAENFHVPKDLTRYTLAENINDSVTSFDIEAGHGLTSGDMPIWVRMFGKNEQMEFTAIATNTITAVRGVNSTSASSHLSGDWIDVDFVAAYITELHGQTDNLNAWLFLFAGGGNGFLRNDDGTSGKVVAQAAPDMTVKIKSGGALINGVPSLFADDQDSDTFVAPIGNPRIDVVEIDEFGDFNILEGEEAGAPSAPSVTAGSLKSSEIYHRVGETSIEDTDDASNGYITDFRVFR